MIYIYIHTYIRTHLTAHIYIPRCMSYLSCVQTQRTGSTWNFFSSQHLLRTALTIRQECPKCGTKWNSKKRQRQRTRKTLGAVYKAWWKVWDRFTSRRPQLFAVETMRGERDRFHLEPYPDHNEPPGFCWIWHPFAALSTREKHRKSGNPYHDHQKESQTGHSNQPATMS